MKAIRKQGVLFLVMVSLFVWVSTASADSIPVQNASFETVATGTTQYDCGGGLSLAQCWYSYNEPIPGWTQGGSNAAAGQFLPGPYFNYVPDGSHTLWVNYGYLEQTVGTVADGVTYTLQVDVGKTIAGQVVNARPQLMIGSTPYLALGLVPPMKGDWETWTVVYTGTAADAGSPINIRIEALQPQTGFDNVRFSDNLQHPVNTPEPASLLLLATGLLGAAFKKLGK